MKDFGKVKTDAVVGNRDLQLLAVVFQVNRDAGRIGMPDDIGQRLLRDAEAGGFSLHGQTDFRQIIDELDVEPG